MDSGVLQVVAVNAYNIRGLNGAKLNSTNVLTANEAKKDKRL
jgi:hypothetical protein